MSNNKNNVNVWEDLWYYGSVFFSFGMTFLLKVIIKKAVNEAIMQ